MKGTTVLLALLVVAGVVAVPVVGAAIQEDSDSGDEVKTGDRIAGVMGVQETELEGELERHAYENELERADEDDGKAAVIAERIEASESRLEELQERKAELDERRESGEISEGRYRAEIAKLSAEIHNARRSLERSETAAAEVPEDTLKENGVNVTAIRELRENADEMNGQEVSEIARSITGDKPGAGPPTEGADENARGAGEDARGNADGSATDRSADRSDQSGDGTGNGDDGESDDESGDDGESDDGGEGQTGDPGNSSKDD